MLLTELDGKLQAEGLVTTGYTVIRGMLPVSPDKVVVLYETGGTGATRFMGSSPTVDGPTVQVVVRGAPEDYAGPRLQIERIYQAMLDWGGFTVAGVKYVSATPLQPPFPFDRATGRDESKRLRFAFNVLLQKELSPLS